MRGEKPHAAGPRFGPAGVPPECSGILDALPFVKGEGLSAFEMEFVQGVKMGPELAGKIGKLAGDLEILLSCHAPYWINCCALEEVKINRSVHHLKDCVDVGQALGDPRFVIVFHPGFYLGQSSAESGKKVMSTMQRVVDVIREKGLRNVVLGMETTGKQSQFGTLDEILGVCSQMDFSVPAVDFAHLHARGRGCMRTEDDYLAVFEKIERKLGATAARGVHCHFSELNFDPVKGNERNHVPIGSASPPSPDFMPLAKVIVKNGLSPVLICESPLQDKDALKMKAIVEEADAAAKK